MSRKISLKLMSVLLFIVGISALIWITSYYIHLPQRISQHETIVLGQSRLVPGSQAALRVLVRDTKDASPLEGAEINVSLKPVNGGRARNVYTGQTDRAGTGAVVFQVPIDVDPDQILTITTRSQLGDDRIEREVTLVREYNILVTTDKPIYQPGQVIHIRALALAAFDRIPASDLPMEITIADGKGNKVYRETLSTSEYGVAAADFQLANLVNTGPYKISASLAGTISEKTVTVEHYVLPKYAVTVEADRAFYMPGEVVSGWLHADYFFGKPVSGGKVKLDAYTFDVERAIFASQQGFTDETGRFEFKFDLPDYIAGSELDGGLGRFYLQATVIDQAEHAETSSISLAVATQPIVIEAIPEGGQFRPGVENILYVLTSYPDGSPAMTRLNLQVYDQNLTLEEETGPFGLAEIRLNPTNPWVSLAIAAQDDRGNAALREFTFDGEAFEESVLLRPERPIYRVGESMGLTILTSQANGTVYLDIIRHGQTVSTRSIQVRDGHAEVAVDLSPDLAGTLTLNAYKVLSWGGITRDTRMVVVDQANDLAVHLTTDREVYRPGDQASLDVMITRDDGQGSQAAFGLAIVDESVFALAEQDPGFASLYFLLEHELLKPRYDLHGFSVPDLLGGKAPPDPQMRAAVEGAAHASLAATDSPDQAFSLQANSHNDAIQRANQQQRKFFTGLSRYLYGLLVLLPMGAFGLSAYAVWRQRYLGRSLFLVAVLLGYLILSFLAWPLGESNSWAQAPLDRLTVMVDMLRWNGEDFLLGLTAIGLASFLALGAVGVSRRERTLSWGLLMIPAYILILSYLMVAASQANLSPSDRVIGWALLAFTCLPLAYLVRFAGYTWARQILPAIASLILAATMIVLILPAAAAGHNTLQARVWLDEVVLEAPADVAGLAFDAALLPRSAPQAEKSPDEGIVTGASSGETQADPPRLRQFFPETMLWIPDAVTDSSGNLHLDFPIADSITTWRVTALASTQDGRLGNASTSLRVFQDFFIDLDLPLALTVGDEVSIPVGVFNYLPDIQTLHLELEPADWFEFLDEPTKTLDIEANEIRVVYFQVRVTRFGRQPFKVTAWGSRMSDAIQKEVRVYPYGKELVFSKSDRLSPGHPVDHTVDIPADAIAGTQSLQVKIYPGVVSQVVEGLESILRMPFGCFEQTSSTTYPNVLVLDYLQTTGQTAPELELKAEEYINLGYQRLTTFEVGGSGGFSLFGDPPPDRMLTAYGLQEFSDMSRVHPVDPALVRRAAEWLMSQQEADGSWKNDNGLVHESTWSSLGNDRLPVTAYVIWSLIDAGFEDTNQTQLGLRYIREFQSQAEDPYVVALVANALVAADLSRGDGLSTATMTLLERLAGLAQVSGNRATWSSQVATFMGSQGQTGSIETTALAALAFLRADRFPELANAALTALIQEKDSFGTWYSTQATVLSLKALIESVRLGAEDIDAQVTVTLSDGQTRTIHVTPETFDVVHSISFEDVRIGGQNVLSISTQGKGNLMYQITGGYYLPWEKVPLHTDIEGDEELLDIEVRYDRAELSVNDTVRVDVNVTLKEGRAESALIDLGLPPGFSVQTDDLAALVDYFNDVPPDYAHPTVERYELTGRQILIYVENLSAGSQLSFSYHLQARFPLRAHTPASQAFDYYNPDVKGNAFPQVLIVNK